MEELLGMDFKSFTNNEFWWIAEVFVVVFATLIIAMIVKRFFGTLNRHAQKSNNFWDDAFFESIMRPAKWMVWIVGLSFAAEIAADQAGASLIDIVPPLRTITTIGVFTWFMVGFVGRIERNLVQPERLNKPMDPTTASAIGKLVRISIIITSTLVTVQSMGYSISGVLAFGGVGGIAVGFAAKDLLANFFGGLMIYLDRPFKVGDWIRSPDKNIEGTVEEIGWRLSRIRTFDKRPLYIPNSTFMQISVENPSRMTNRRIYETIGIRYDDVGKMSEIVEAVKAMIEQHPDLDMNQTVIVNFNKFAASSLDFFVYCFTKTTNWVDYHEIKQDVLLQIISIIESHNAECAFPTSTVHVPNALQLEQGAAQ